ncbi:membrane alanyl aminopeptidase-like [Cotesia glomerata]|nr:membrane alanyl aminopeptidase-like [Cotesia glomerata]XP_044585651.1 membrane alanyl aminopeptidase-like [Cotesia glomerata]
MSLMQITLFAVFFMATTQAIPPLLDSPNFYDAPEVLREDSKEDYQLPTDVEPSNYVIDLTLKYLDGKDFSFSGTSTIDINVTKDTDTIVLHAQNLTIDSAITLSNVTTPSTTIPYDSNSIDHVTNFLKIKYKQNIVAGNYRLKLSYTGFINDQLRGFYRGHYTDDLGVTRWIASTHFEPVGARLAFPCWDEPAMKAKFTISITHHMDFKALSNTQFKSIEMKSNNLVKTTFETTPKMSTYLVAYAVVDFDHMGNENDKSFRIWARKNAIKHGKYAADIGLKALKALETYTKINYQSHGFTKMDSIALPQFAAGAMENWGLVTYSETGLLFDEEKSSLYDKEAIAKIIAHEFAHQWFGNLVSPKWWQYVWLNEGFASYLQYVITAEVENKWRLMERFVVENLQNSAFIADSFNTSHEMEVAVSSPKEISSIFDSITYSKAASVIRMISYVMGEDKFKTALQSYLQKYKNAVATSKELFAELVTQADASIKTFFEDALLNWATMSGYPVVNIVRDYKNKKANVTQSRFLSGQNKTSSLKYWIPLNFATQEQPDFDNIASTITWFNPKNEFVTVTAPAENQWLICNKQQFGYYRVNYDEQNWKLITQFLTNNHTAINLLNRAQLIDDVFNLARLNYTKYKIAFNLIGYLKKEADFVPWSSAWNGISYLNRLLANTKLSNDFRDYITSLTGKSIESVKFEESDTDEHITKLHRMKLIDNTCSMSLKSCIDYATKKFNLWLNDSTSNPLSRNLKKIIICNGVRNADNATWNKLLSKYNDNQDDDDDILAGLGCTSNKGLLNSYLRMAINDSFLGGNRDKIFKAVYEGSDLGVDVSLDFLNSNIHDLLLSNSASAENVKTYISDIGSKVTNKNQIAKIENVRTQDTSLMTGVIDDGLKKAQANVEWLNSRFEEIDEFFKKPVTPSPTNQPGSGTTFAVSLTLLSFSFALIYLN